MGDSNQHKNEGSRAGTPEKQGKGSQSSHGATGPAADSTSGPGGKGFNQAIAAGRAGAQTCFVCALGDDAGGVLARGLATADQIDLQDFIADQPTGTAGIYVDAHGRNCIVIGAGANAALTPAFVEQQRDAIAAAGALLTQLESPSDSIQYALSIARANGVVTILNPAPANAAAPVALTNWKAAVANTLPGISDGVNQPTVDVTAIGGANDGTVTVTIFWHAPGDPSPDAHKYVTVAQIR